MGWFGKQHTPTYSPIGEAIYRLLVEEEGKWVIGDLYLQTGQYLLHPVAEVALSLSTHKMKVFDYTRISTTSFIGDQLNLTSDDLIRLRERAELLQKTILEGQKKTTENRVLNKITQHLKTPCPFDDACRSLARAVLNNDDMVAARALADKIQELSQDA